MLRTYEIWAANDGAYSPNRHRTLPIHATVTPIANYPSKLRIYMTNASRFWQVRCFFKGKTYSQSLRTSNKTSAISLAKQFFHIKSAELYGEAIKQRTSETLFADVVPAALALQQARVQRGELSSAGLRIFQNRLHKTIVPYFGKMAMNRIGYTQLSNFIQQLGATGMTSTTIQQHVVATRKIFSYAYSVNLIPSVPKFPSIKVTSKPRGSFSLAEYRLLARTASRIAGERVPITTTQRSKRGREHVDRYAEITRELHWLIRFMVNSFVRPSDIKNLQHKHVTVVRGRHTYLRLNLPESKLHDKPIVTLAPAVGVYERLLDQHRAQGMGKADDYVFMPSQLDRSRVLEIFGWQFKHVQAVAGIGENKANGMSRTLYSLRHTAITLRLLYGGKIDLLTLARNARTSVEMIEKFYSSNLSAEMNIDLLQGRR
jgi:hypothetical protein